MGSCFLHSPPPPRHCPPSVPSPPLSHLQLSLRVTKAGREDEIILPSSNCLDIFTTQITLGRALPLLLRRTRLIHTHMSCLHSGAAGARAFVVEGDRRHCADDIIQEEEVLRVRDASVRRGHDMNQGSVADRGIHMCTTVLWSSIRHATAAA